MAKSHKKTKGNQYRNNEEFAEEVMDKNAKRPAQNNPSTGTKKQ